MTPNQPTEINFEMPDVYHTFRRGHRVMVQIQSSWFPLVDRNPQKFMDIPKARPEDFVDFCQMGPFEKMQISRDLYNLARREMDEMAKASGGRNFLASSLQDARAAFARVANEIGTQYSLGYYPTNKARDGKFRTIRVEVQGSPDRPQVRAREGYYAPKS